MATILLGGLEYLVEPLRLRQASEWRQALADALAPVFAQSPVHGLGQLAEAVKSVAPVSLTPEAKLEFVLGWSDQLEADRERILDHGTDAEVATAFLALLELAYPFGGPPARAATNGAVRAQLQPT